MLPHRLPASELGANQRTAERTVEEQTVYELFEVAIAEGSAIDGVAPTPEAIRPGRAPQTGGCAESEGIRKRVPQLLAAPDRSPIG